VRREAANRVTIYCWYQRRCDGGGVEGVDAPSPRQLSLPLPRQNEQELLYDSHSTGVYAWDASLDADTAITGKRMVVYLVRTPPPTFAPVKLIARWAPTPGGTGRRASLRAAPAEPRTEMWAFQASRGYSQEAAASSSHRERRKEGTERVLNHE
jgi:hypothetical protein